MELSQKEYYTGVFLTILYNLGLLGLGLGFLELLFNSEPVYTYLTAGIFASLFVIGKLLMMSFVKYSLKMVELKTIYTQVLVVIGLAGVFFEFYSAFISPSYEAFYYTLLIYSLFADRIISYHYFDGHHTEQIFQG